MTLRLLGRGRFVRVVPDAPVGGSLTFRAAAGAANTGGGSLTINVPSGTTNGDQMIMAICTTHPDTISTPSGWTLIGSRANSANNYPSLYVFSRTASSEPSSYTITSGTFYLAGGILSYYGGTGLGAFTTNSGSGTTATASSVTATANSLILSCFFEGDATSISLPSGDTSRVYEGTSGTTYFVRVTEHGPVTAGATSAKAATLGSSQSWVTATVEVLA